MNLFRVLACVYELLFTRYVDDPDAPPAAAYYPDGERV